MQYFIKHSFRNILQIFLRRTLIICALVLVVLCGILAICFLVPVPPKASIDPVSTANSTTMPADTVYVYVAEYLYHTGLILPVRSGVHDWSKEIDCLETSEYAEFGWGDSTYFMAGTVNIRMALSALFASRASVMGVVGLDAPPFYTQPTQMQRLSLKPSEYAACVAYLRSCFVWKPNGENKGAERIQQGFWGNRSAFYQANPASVGRYSFVNNCNVWSARCLRHTGRTTPLWAGIPQVLQWHVQTKK
ncbi:MAG: DUF2459 domain-containing protein [Candidatus Kapaibacterium sp.]|nr:MAG: DUF2459 domain-containing protein [Candidatus Kapabacteria bacterium]